MTHVNNLCAAFVFFKTNFLLFVLAKFPSIETLLQYEIELKNMLETIRSQIDTIVNREIDAENEYVEHNRLVRDISQVELITNDALSNATNASFTLYIGQNTTTVTTIPVVFRLLNVLTGTTPDANYLNSTSATATNDNQTSSIQSETTTTTTSSSTVKQTIMADKPDVQQTKGALGDPKAGDFTPPPFLEPFRNGRQVGLSDLLLVNADFLSVKLVNHAQFLVVECHKMHSINRRTTGQRIEATRHIQSRFYGLGRSWSFEFFRKS